MSIWSPGLRSDFIFHDFAAVVADLGDCVQVRTPNNSDYFFGNLLIFPCPPQPGQVNEWVERFEQVFAPFPEVRHRAFQWEPVATIDSVARAQLQDAGFTVDTVSVLTATQTHLDKAPPMGVEFRPIQSDREWQEVIHAQASEGFPSIPMDEFLAYKEDTFANYRAMSEQGLGNWWGAFKGEELVADLGLFFGRGIGRFQSVQTRRAHQRQGICRAFVHHVSQHGFASHPSTSLMLHADEGEIAEGIYKSLGYTKT